MLATLVAFAAFPLGPERQPTGLSRRINAPAAFSGHQMGSLVRCMTRSAASVAGCGRMRASHPDVGAGRGVRHRDPRRIAAARLAARPEHRRARPGGASAICIGGGSFALLVGARRRSRTCCRSRSPTRCCCVGYSFLLAGARAFAGRDTPVDGVPGRAADLAHRHEGAGDRARHQPACHHRLGACNAASVALMAYEFWRERAEPLLSRWPAIILLGTHVVDAERPHDRRA